MSMRELGRTSGVSVAAISKYEMGALKPSHDTLVKLCKALALDHKELLKKFYLNLNEAVDEEETLSDLAEIIKIYNSLDPVDKKRMTRIVKAAFFVD